jgi:hypothetical protein
MRYGFGAMEEPDDHTPPFNVSGKIGVFDLPSFGLQLLDLAKKVKISLDLVLMLSTLRSSTRDPSIG